MADNGFARGILEKYGWTEGKGLGKNETGIAKALKPKIKFDTAGMGHKIDLTSQWWSKAFNDAAKSIKVDMSDGATTISKVNEKRKKKALPRDCYSGFIKAGIQDGNSWVQASPAVEMHRYAEEEESSEGIPDEELFKACGGLTAHKAARHGHSMSGKLKRVQKQDGLLCMPSNGRDELPNKRAVLLKDSCQVVAQDDGSPNVMLEQLKKKSHKRKKRKLKHATDHVGGSSIKGIKGIISC
uniref:G patch domain-containing protein 4 n=1 Tax=Amblyomma triste TaxID=251400 RepID=A0A023GF78_AMBTT